ncbi:hypothetical protein MLD38_018442 [Melastoma candidum]|uniref:Uncharacterized protein n=1 Tax=Melastoma candidum TaxID=119954 RepID=A0ACB9R231_9MYRT|nr:hypothetical protein MLD38_018442 [Melastoma candidum]
MGRASRWFRNFLGLKKPTDPAPTSSSSLHVREKRRWSFVKSSHREPPPPPAPIVDIPAAASRGGYAGEVKVARGGWREPEGEEEAAAVVIQSAFRGYLARRALRALKGLVKLQALVRGYIVRKKRTAQWLCQMQALLRAQARARSDRAQISASSHSQSSSKCSLLPQHPGPGTPEKLEPMASCAKSCVRGRSPGKCGSSSKMGRNRSDRIVDRKLWDQRGGHSTGSGWSGEDDRGDKILEVDSGTVNASSGAVGRHFHRMSRSFTTSKDSSYGEVQSAYPVGFLMDEAEEEAEFCTANSSPQFYLVSSRNQNSGRSPFTPSKTDDARSYYGGFSDYPSYMSYTESSRAKVRSASAPRQRPHFEKSGSLKRNSAHGFGEPRTGLHKSSATTWANYTNRAYPGSGRLDRYGMPIRGDLVGYKRVD